MNRIILTGIAVFAACCCISCKEKVHEILQIVVFNRTDSLLYIKLYPQKTTVSGGFYPMSDIGGGHKLTEFDLSPGGDAYYDYWDGVLFETKDLNIAPYTLAANIFDSIHVGFANNDSVIISFTHNRVTGYSENIFKENSTWDFKISEYTLGDMRSSNPQKAYLYFFQISEDKITIE
ncbi:MAG: hypothetical protein LBV47_06750 [Bacteroidales bacterium]|jgi:hypothetical protein|nr:hypothetical protein [Bacteroidales bacterium]